MTKSPDPIYKTKDELERLYVKHSFDSQISDCETITICREKYSGDFPYRPETTEVIGLKHRLNGKTIAVIFHYTFTDGTTSRSIRMLLIDGVHHQAPQLPPY